MQGQCRESKSYQVIGLVWNIVTKERRCIVPYHGGLYRKYLQLFRFGHLGYASLPIGGPKSHGMFNSHLFFFNWHPTGSTKCCAVVSASFRRRKMGGQLCRFRGCNHCQLAWASVPQSRVINHKFPHDNYHFWWVNSAFLKTPMLDEKPYFFAWANPIAGSQYSNKCLEEVLFSSSVTVMTARTTGIHSHHGSSEIVEDVQLQVEPRTDQGKHHLHQMQVQKTGWWFQTWLLFSIYGMSSWTHWRTPSFFKMVIAPPTRWTSISGPTRFDSWQS